MKKQKLALGALQIKSFVTRKVTGGILTDSVNGCLSNLTGCCPSQPPCGGGTNNGCQTFGCPPETDGCPGSNYDCGITSPPGCNTDFFCTGTC